MSNDAPETASPQSRTARLLAIEVLLAEPEALGNDALEGDLYILRDRLNGTADSTPQQ